MKRFFGWLFVLCSIFFAGCNTNKTSDVEITCADVSTAYEKAGYGVFYRETQADEDREYNCYVQVTSADGEDNIYIHFFDTHEEALAYVEETPYASIGIGLFSLIFGDPTWVTFKTYNQIAIDYTDAELYKPFQQLLREKQ